MANKTNNNANGKWGLKNIFKIFHICDGECDKNCSVDPSFSTTLKSSLQNYSGHHDYFSFYTELEHYKDDNEFYLFFSRPMHWTDKNDANKYKDEENISFVRCMNYQISENIAMWYMYGYPNNIRIKIDGPTLRNAISNKTYKIKIVYKEKGKKKLTKASKIIDVNCISIDRFDVLYFAKESKRTNGNKDGYFLEKGTQILKNRCLKNVEALLNEKFMKRYAFASEVETRFEFEISKKELKQLIKNNDLNINNEERIVGLKLYFDLLKDKISIFRRPDFIKINGLFETSDYYKCDDVCGIDIQDSELNDEK